MAGRKKLKITRDLIIEHEYYLSDFDFFEYLYPIEIEFLERINNNVWNKIFFEDIRKVYLECRYKRNERNKLKNGLITIIKKDKETLTNMENYILELYEILKEEQRKEIYFSLQNALRKYLKNLPDKVQASFIKNTLTNQHTDEEDREKAIRKKNLNHEKYFLGGAFKLVHRTLCDKQLHGTQNKNEVDLMIDMLKIFTVYNILHKENYDQILQRYNQLENQGITETISECIHRIRNDLKSPYQKLEENTNS